MRSKSSDNKSGEFERTSGRFRTRGGLAMSTPFCPLRNLKSVECLRRPGKSSPVDACSVGCESEGRKRACVIFRALCLCEFAEV